LLDALNPRGFRELELFENISFFKEIYTKEMNDVLDVLKDRHSQRPLSFKLFGFSSSIPKELSGGEAEDVDDTLFNDITSHLLQLDEFVSVIYIYKLLLFLFRCMKEDLVLLVAQLIVINGD
jgi:hypothetical protein